MISNFKSKTCWRCSATVPLDTRICPYCGAAEKNDNELSNWIVTTFDKILIDDKTQIALKHDEKTPDKLKEAKLTEISFAAKIENGKLKEIHGEESLIFTYLPTKEISFEFPFLVNGNFLTSASRESIHEDRVWNQWLFHLIGEKIFDWFELLSQSKYKFQLLHLLPKKYYSITNSLKTSFNKSFDLYGKTKGNGEIKFVHANLRNNLSDYCNKFSIGDNLVMEFTIERYTDLESVKIGVEIITEDGIKQLSRQVKTQVREAVEWAKNSPETPIEELYRDVYVDHWGPFTGTSKPEIMRNETNE